MLLEAFLEESARRFPQKTALVFQAARLSYAEIERLSNRLAHALQEGGVQRGDRVAIFLENSVEAVVSIFAVLKTGAVFLMINPSTQADKLAFVLNDCRAVALVSHTKLEGVFSAVEERVASLRLLILAGPEASGEGRRPAVRLRWETLLARPAQEAYSPPLKESIDIDLAALLYTSGSTGFPKGVMMTHLNMVAAARSINQYLENTGDDILLSALPLSFDYGLYQVLMAFQTGATVVLEKTFAYPAVILERLVQEKVTGFPIVPTMAAILLQMKGFHGNRYPHLRYLTNTAAALPPAHVERLRERFPTTKIYSMYGLTECKRVSYLPPDQFAARPTSVGKAIPNTEVYLVDERGKRIGPGEVGELVVRGAHVMKGYWERPEETDRALRPGSLPGEKVLYTGDLFTMDEEGFLYFVERKDDIIKTRGEKVSPREVEAALYRLPEVAEAAVVGTPDPILGQAVKAVIVLTEEGRLTERDILHHCARFLEDFMIPKVVEFRKTLPKTATGKVSKKELAVHAGA